MSTTSFYAQAVPVSRPPEASSWPWVIVIIILIIVIIALAIWLVVRHTNDSNNGKQKIFNLPGAKITANNSSVQGSWTKLENVNDVVTLCISTEPLAFNSDGSVVQNSSVTCDNEDSNNTNGGSIVLQAQEGIIYNATMTVSSVDAVNYRIFGPTRVFTQDQKDLNVNSDVTKNPTFTIQNLNALGAVSNTSNTPSYTTYPNQFGNYRLGSLNSAPNTFLVKYNDGDDFNTQSESSGHPLILCKQNTNLNLVLAEWESDNNIHAIGDDSSSGKIPISQCQWAYNSALLGTPGAPGAQGENRWCLTSAQSISSNTQTQTANLCLTRNGTNGIALSTISSNGVSSANMWYNQLYPTP